MIHEPSRSETHIVITDFLEEKANIVHRLGTASWSSFIKMKFLVRPSSPKISILQLSYLWLIFLSTKKVRSINASIISKILEFTYLKNIDLLISSFRLYEKNTM